MGKEDEGKVMEDRDGEWGQVTEHAMDQDRGYKWERIEMKTEDGETDYYLC